MYGKDITSKIQRHYIDEYLESSRIINYTDLSDMGDDTFTILYKDLPKREIVGYPFASDYVSKEGMTYTVDEFFTLPESERKKCDLRFYYGPLSHELYCGTTGSGKTTGCVEPQLRAISSQKNKPDLFITDPKGELFDRNAMHLKKQGYRLMILNFKDLIRSDRWNPLYKLYELEMSRCHIGKNVVLRTGKVDPTLELYAPEEEFTDKTYLEYRGKAFPGSEKLSVYFDFERDFLDAEIDNEIAQLVNMFVQVKSTKDPSWERGAQTLLHGIILAMLHDARTPESGFTREMMTIKTIKDYYFAIKKPCLNDKSTQIDDIDCLKDKPDTVKQVLSNVVETAPVTRQGFFSTFESAISEWFQAHVFALTTNNTITYEQLNDDQPFAIFVVTRDYEKSDFRVAGLFIDWVYSQMIKRAEDKNGKKRAVHFLLDEFGNIPKIPNLENKISTARSRNVWFHLFVQSYQQIEVVYNDNNTPTATIIRDNCNSLIFLGAQNRSTREIFSKECGEHAIPALSSKLVLGNNDITTVPLVPISALDLITPGKMYIKPLNKPVITSQYVRSYLAAANGDFKYFGSNGLLTCSPMLIDPFNSPKYTFPLLFAKKKNPFDF